MIDNHYIELMNRQLDGFASQSEQKKLRQYLSENQEANEFFASLERAVQELRNVPRMASPVGLKDSIMAKINERAFARGTSQGSSKNIIASLRERLLQRPTYLFLSGAVAATVIIAIASGLTGLNDAPSMSNVTGSLVNPSTGASLSVASCKLRVGSSLGDVTVSRVRHETTNEVVVTVHLNSAEAVHFMIRFNAADLAPVSLDGNTNDPVVANHADGSVAFSSAGQVSHTVTFSDISPEVSTLVVSLGNGVSEVEQVLTTGVHSGVR